LLSQLGNLVETVTLHPAAPRIIGFASPGPGEGTSTCLALVGAYLASRHARVLMVDANQHHPALHTIANVEACPGLAELVTGEVEMHNAVRPTELPDLFLVTNGTPEGGNASAVLAPAAVRESLLQYATIFDFVLVDCAPINTYADAAGIAGACEAVIMVIDGSRTRREAAQSSKALLARSNCSVLGVFMNKRKFYIPAFLYNRL
jgi:capsular exopolysaccharide synthesis family protein